MATHKIVDRDLVCPILETYLHRVMLDAFDLDLMYEHAREEINVLQERSSVAGGERAVQHLRGFVVVELLGTTIWSAGAVGGSSNPARTRDFAEQQALLIRRNADSLTRYIEWARCQIPEREADRISYQHYSKEPLRDLLAHRSRKAVLVYNISSEAAELLRRSLKNPEIQLGRLGTLLYEGCRETGINIPEQINYARKLLNVTQAHAPRGWERWDK